MKWLSCLMIVLLSACSWFPATTTPMAVYRSPSERTSDTLLVLLPGRGDRGADFEKNGFAELRQPGAFDVMAADAHFGYYVGRVIVERLHEDVILPARAMGYERIWLLGISAGGLGANLYAQRHPDLVDGIILLAPYPGDSALVEDIRAAGGLAAWRGQSRNGEAYQRETWRWLKQVTERPGPPTIVLGYGRDDRFADAASMLAERLPSGQVFTVPGGHDWSTWRRLWSDIRVAGFPVGRN